MKLRTTQLPCEEKRNQPARNPTLGEAFLNGSSSPGNYIDGRSCALNHYARVCHNCRDTEERAID